jgi:uncharacterized integral membrane protein
MTAGQPPRTPGETSRAHEPAVGASEPPAATQPTYDEVPAKPPRTRISTAFSGTVAGVIVLILLLIFILENTESVQISWLGLGGHIALGVALLLAAVGGALIVAILGVARIAQVRRHGRVSGRRRTKRRRYASAH